MLVYVFTKTLYNFIAENKIQDPFAKYTSLLWWSRSCPSALSFDVGWKIAALMGKAMPRARLTLATSNIFLAITEEGLIPSALKPSMTNTGTEVHAKDIAALAIIV